jgi:ribosomal protein L37AE/L43A
MKLTCPNCGDNVLYRVGTDCVYCNTCGTKSRIPDLQIKVSENNSTFDSSKYICSSCGSIIISMDDSPIEICNYCGSMEFSVEKFQFNNTINRIIRFSYSRDNFINNYRYYVKKNKYSEIKEFSEKNIKSIKGIYVPVRYVIYDVRGYTNDYKEQAESTNDGTKVFRILEYDRNYSVYVPFDLNKEIEDLTVASLHPYNLERAVDFSPYYVAGFSIANSDDKSWKYLPNAEEQIKDELFEKKVPSRIKELYRKNDISWDMKIVDNNFTVYVPIWICNYEFKGKKFMYAMNGQTGKIVSQLPVDKRIVMAQLNKSYKPLYVLMGIVFLIMYPILSIIMAIILDSMVRRKASTIEHIEAFITMVCCIIIFSFGMYGFARFKNSMINEEEKIKDNVNSQVNKVTDNTHDYSNRIVIREKKQNK